MLWFVNTATMKASTLCYMLAATSVAGTAGAQNASSQYLDTSFGWQPEFIEIIAAGPITPQTQQARRYTGVPTSSAVLQQSRIRDEDQSKMRCHGWRFMPATPQRFMPYLDSLFVPGNTCVEPGGWFDYCPVSNGAQRVKSFLSEYGLQYDLTMSYNYAAVHPKPRGQQGEFSSFNHSLTGTWFLAKDCDNSQGVFLTFEADWGQGTNFSERHRSAQHTLGSLSDPQGSLRGSKGVFLPQVALGYSGFNGKWVAMAGTIDVSNYMDQNAYTPGWGSGGLLNSSLSNNPALPLTWGNLGFLTAWQPCDSFYAMYATTSTNTQVNHNPFSDLSSNYWMHMAEVGFIVDDAMGLGSGIYRLQYTMIDNGGDCGLGGGINIQQQLGKNSPLGFFTRAAFMDQDAAAVTGTKAYASAGFMLQAPFTQSGWGSRSNHENISFGFLWQRAASNQEPVEHKDEYGLELSMVMQVTPTFYLQPDLQYIFNPIHATDGDDGAFVMQIQGVFKF